jgi:FKBP-type peptidyl-prolyl cis-trans isomerase FkpA
MPQIVLRRHPRRRLIGVLGLLAAMMTWSAGCIAQPTFAPGPRDPDAPTEFEETASGLKYRILRKSTGKKPSESNQVTVHYVGTLDNGSEFDSSYRTGRPATFSLGQVVAGWTEGLQLIGEGGMIELEIPPALGYGAQGAAGSIPPNATLHFIVELISVE